MQQHVRKLAIAGLTFIALLTIVVVAKAEPPAVKAHRITDDSMKGHCHHRHHKHHHRQIEPAPPLDSGGPIG